MTSFSLFTVLILCLLLWQNDAKKASSHSRMRAWKGRPVIIPMKKEALTAKVRRSLAGLIWRTSKRTKDSLQSLNRSLKSFFASDFEGLILRLTSPTSQALDEGDLIRFMDTVNCFSKQINPKDFNNPYRVTLRKLDSKLIESSPNTQAKALYLLHMLSTADDGLFQSTITQMCSQKRRKRHGKYFSFGIFVSSFVSSYADYVLYRMKHLPGSFDTLATTQRSSPQELAKQLQSAVEALQLAQCCVLDTPSEVFVECLELLTSDVSQLLTWLVKQLQYIAQEHEVSDLLGELTEPQVQGFLGYFKSFYQENYDSLALFLQEAEDVMEIYGREAFKMPARDALQDLPDASSQEEAEAVLRMLTTA